MKKIIASISALLLVSTLVFIACQKEKIAGALYAPNGDFVSNSWKDLGFSIATTTQVDPEDLVITGVSYLNTPKGFIAAVDVFFKSTQLSNRVYCVSPDLFPEIKFEGNVVRNGNTANAGIQDRVVALPVIYCSCGDINLASSSCSATITVNPSGSVSGKCSAVNCPSGCYVHIAM